MRVVWFGLFVVFDCLDGFWLYSLLNCIRLLYCRLCRLLADYVVFVIWSECNSVVTVFMLSICCVEFYFVYLAYFDC